MLYLTIFWIGILCLGIAYVASSIFNIPRIKQSIEDKGMLIAIMLWSLVVIAIKTDDPIQLLGIEIPMQFQWLGSLCIAGFTAWKLYLHPLKKKVDRMDKELSGFPLGLTTVQERLKTVEAKVHTVDLKINGLDREMGEVRSELGIIKERLFKIPLG